MKKTDPKEKRRLAIMRSAKTSAENKTGMGGLPKGKGHTPRPVTLAPTPWDKPKP